MCIIRSIIHCNRRLGAFANPPILYGWIYPNLLMVLMIISTYCCVSTAPYSVLNCCDVISLWKDMIDWSRWRISWLAVYDTLSSIFEYHIHRHSHFHLIYLTTCSNTRTQTYTHNTHTTINFKDCPYVGSFRAGVLFLRISHVQISGKVEWCELNWIEVRFDRLLF